MATCCGRIRKQNGLGTHKACAVHPTCHTVKCGDIGITLRVRGLDCDGLGVSVRGGARLGLLRRVTKSASKA